MTCFDRYMCCYMLVFASQLYIIIDKSCNCYKTTEAFKIWSKFKLKLELGPTLLLKSSTL